MNSALISAYLMFQVFVSGASSSSFPPQGEVEGTVKNIVGRIGQRGDARHKLGFAVGPISFNHSDQEVKRLIGESFDIARRNNVAVALHLDDHMFWEQRADLVNDKANVEWTDWDGHACSGRRLDWGPEPNKVAPQMCFNSPAIKKAVKQRAQLIASETKRQILRLRAERREDLFAGIIIGWETQIGRDFATNRNTGFHALNNAGFSAKNSTAQCEAELVKITKSFMELWASSLEQGGIAKDKVYAHIGYMPQGFGTPPGLTYLQAVGFAPAQVAFSSVYRPGFSTYPFGDTLEQVEREVAKNGNPPWISAEGTNVVPNGMPGEAGMETYLAKMFNHGAVMVNIFSWGVGGDSQKNNHFRRATEGEEALAAYRKFLSGAALQEGKRSAGTFSPQRLQQKVHTIQTEAPLWVQRTGRIDQVQPLMNKLDAAIKSNNFNAADQAADEVLRLIGK